MRQVVTIASILALITSGLAAQAAPDQGDSTTVEHAYAFSGCDLMTTAIRVDIEAARAVVAPGFEPLDGGHMFNANPQLFETGTAVLVIGGLSCAHIAAAGGPGAFAWAWIDIEEPSVAGEPSPSAHDGYGLFDIVERPAHLAFLQQARMPAVLGAVSLVVEKANPTDVGEALGTMRIDGPEGTLAQIVAVGAGSLDAGVTLANWHQSDEGVGLTHLKSASSVKLYVAKAVTCRVAEGSVLAWLVGGTDCTAANGQGAIATGLTNDGYVKFWPGVQPDAP